MLEELGLDSRTEAVYRLMLTHRDCGIREMAISLHASESAVRESLTRLADLTLLRQSLDAPEQMRPVNPEVGYWLSASTPSCWKGTSGSPKAGRPCHS